MPKEMSIFSSSCGNKARPNSARRKVRMVRVLPSTRVSKDKQEIITVPRRNPGTASLSVVCQGDVVGGASTPTQLLKRRPRAQKHSFASPRADAVAVNCSLRAKMGCCVLAEHPQA